MLDLKTTTNLVKYILETEPKTRNSDYLLYLSVIRKIAAVKGVNLDSVKVIDFLSNESLKSQFPPIESVGRVRRKLQEKNPDFAATLPVRKQRAEKEAEYIAYARG